MDEYVNNLKTTIVFKSDDCPETDLPNDFNGLIFLVGRKNGGNREKRRLLIHLNGLSG
ncbi:hypothetical protein [Enterococcus sp. AZ196]|uniref:hypothetical protein n=1 Tax=Enterococcus sp. AZ196 TaxID=2774659 RepID=UPI003D2D8A17